MALASRFPGVESERAYGHIGFLTRKTKFAWYLVDHHGDNRLALWVKAPPGQQGDLVHGDPGRFFAPPYLGPRGWVGAMLDDESDPDWDLIEELFEQAFRMSATKKDIAAYGDGRG